MLKACDRSRSPLQRCYFGYLRNIEPEALDLSIRIDLQKHGTRARKLSAIFPPGPTFSGEVHSMTFLVNVFCILLSSVLLSIGFRSDPRWRAFRTTAATLAALLVFAFVLQFLTAYFEVRYGLANRFFAAVLVAWLLAISIQVARLGARVNSGPLEAEGCLRRKQGPD